MDPLDFDSLRGALCLSLGDYDDWAVHPIAFLDDHAVVALFPKSPQQIKRVHAPALNSRAVSPGVLRQSRSTAKSHSTRASNFVVPTVTKTVRFAMLGMLLHLRQANSNGQCLWD